jgi:hypothetical protein
MRDTALSKEAQDFARSQHRAKVEAFRRLEWSWLAAMAAYHDPAAPDDDDHMEALARKQEAAELALLTTPSPTTWGVWTKWEILDSLATKEVLAGHLEDNRMIVAPAAIKADVLRFGLGEP